MWLTKLVGKLAGKRLTASVTVAALVALAIAVPDAANVLNKSCGLWSKVQPPPGLQSLTPSPDA